MKKHFYTGLVIVLPLLITFYIFNWLVKTVINLISGRTITKLIGFILNLLFRNHSHEVLFEVLTYIISISIILCVITLFGYTMKLMIFSKIVKKITNIVEKIPVIKSVYTTARQIIGIIYSSEGESAYRKVVAVEYPRKGMYAIGFMTSESNEMVSTAFGETEVANIFIPTSPNPTSGMLICVPKKDVKVLDMDTETAFKLIISGGYVTEESVKKLKNIEDKER